MNGANKNMTPLTLRFCASQFKGQSPCLRVDAVNTEYPECPEIISESRTIRFSYNPLAAVRVDFGVEEAVLCFNPASHNGYGTCLAGCHRPTAADPDKWVRLLENELRLHAITGLHQMVQNQGLNRKLQLSPNV